MSKRFKYLAIFHARSELLESLSASISPEIIARWTAELQNVYLHRFVPLDNPKKYNPKYMDDVFRTKFDGGQYIFIFSSALLTCHKHLTAKLLKTCSSRRNDALA